ncbi:MAG TPA: cyclic nucleotide-binding domain-containing protein [Myxococcales bacterium]|nr:cyclic nucleotide-binding domain-containing protein [Myxococcales bacterium]
MNVPGSEAFRTFLRSAPVFGGLEGRSLENVRAMLKPLQLPAGSVIFSDGELGRTMYLLANGEVEVRGRSASGRHVPLVRLGPGECFGEMALVELQPRSATVVATRKSLLYSLNNLDLYRLFQNDNYAYVIVLQNICRLLSRRLRKADGRICDFLDPGGRQALEAAAAAAEQEDRKVVRPKGMKVKVRAKAGGGR